MPPKKAVDTPKEKLECILKYGKQNNVVQWSEEMQTEVESHYGSVGEFFTTNESYTIPRVDEDELMSALPSIPESDSSDDEGYDQAEDEESAPPSAEVILERAERLQRTEESRTARAARRRVATSRNDKLLTKLREGAYEGRRKAIELQRENEKKIWPMMWSRMSAGSQSRVKEEEGFAIARSKLDCVRLWGFIRETHLTHMFGVGDPMKEVNAIEQEIRFAAMRQGDREFISTFKVRFDNQVKANTGAGVPVPSERKLALEFIMKLDTKRYRKMLTQMRNDSLRSEEDAYPSTLASAYRIASGWANEDHSGGGHGSESNSAFLTDQCFVTKAKDPAGLKTTVTPGQPKADKKKKADIECYVCGGSHFARDCEQRKGFKEKAHVTLDSPKSEDEEEDIDEWGAALISIQESCLFSKNELLLDNQASLNIFGNKDLLTNIRTAEKPISLSGIQAGAKAVKVNKIGDFHDFGAVYYSEGAAANILSFASQVNAGSKIVYDGKADVFTLTPVSGKRTYTFKRKNVRGSENRFYSCDVAAANNETVLVQTVKDNLQMFTKREIGQAHKAREMLGRMGFPSVKDAIDMVSSGANYEITGKDFQVADAIWGKDMASMKGKTTRRATNVANMEVKRFESQQQQILSVDIMFVEKLPFLVGVATPLDLTLVKSLTTVDMKKPSRAAEAVRIGLLYFIGILESQNFKTTALMVDGEGSISKLVTELHSRGVEVDVTGAGGHVKVVERRIRVIKECIRTQLSSLPYALTLTALSMCVLYCVSRLNYQPTRIRDGIMSPREAFLGRKTDAKRDFRCAFGDFVMATVPETDNSMKSRTEDCIVMLPTGNRTGSVRMLSLATGKIVTRDQFKIMPMPTSVIQRMNDLARANGRTMTDTPGVHYEHAVDDLPALPQPIPHQIMPIPHVGDDPWVEHIPHDNPHPPAELADEVGMYPNDRDDGEAGGGEMQQPAYDPHFDAHGPINNDADGEHMRGDAGMRGGEHDHDEDPGGIRGDAEEIGGDVGEDSPDAQQGPPHAPLHRGILDFFRTGQGELVYMAESGRELGTARALEKKHTERPDEVEHAMNITVREALRTRGDEAERVIMKELQQMLTKKVWTPVHGKTLTADQRSRVIRSSMFLKEKFLPTGEFEKLKARLVAGGDQQDKSLYDDLSAPTVSASCVFTILSIAAHEGRRAEVVDIGGAFLNAEMKTGVDVHMRLDKTMSDLMIRLDPAYSEYSDGKGSITVILDRALYGCVESAALWYENLRETLQKLGYEYNKYDICVFNRRTADGTQCTVAVHVDDLLITSTSQDMIDHLTHGLKVRYGEISKSEGTILNYLGMVFDLSHPGEARVTMKGYVDVVLELSKVDGGARTPATEGLFEVREHGERVGEEEMKVFRSEVMRLMYLAKKTHPDLLMTVSYLATRVTKCTTDDLVKLRRLLRYLNVTRGRGIVLRIGSEGICVRVYIDAAYGIHADGKSHTGSVVVIGEVGPVHCRSGKQSIVSKSSTEAELIALSDSANQGLFMRNFLLEQGHKMGPVIIYQDNMSCMAMMARGRSGNEKSRHIHIRYFWLKERIDAGEAVIRHMGTADMYANLLTKPLQGAQFVGERDALTGWGEDVV